MADVILNQSADRVKAILSRLSPFIGNGGKASAFGFAYAVCNTAGDIAVKQVSIPDYIRTEGAIIAVHFVNAFTVSNPKIQVGSYAPADIKLYGSALAPGKVRDNTVVAMRYAAGEYQVISIESKSGMSTQGAVDLALPSGVLWCEHNVGASRPEEAGLYFSWGNVKGYAAGASYSFSQANYEASAGFTLGGDIPVNDAFDMAHHNMGGQWRLPRYSEIMELVDNCDCEYISQDGVPGCRFTSRINGNSIFLPLVGTWEDTSIEGAGEWAYYLCAHFFATWHSGSGLLVDNEADPGRWPEALSPRYVGACVRAVM